MLTKRLSFTKQGTLKTSKTKELPSKEKDLPTCNCYLYENLEMFQQKLH
jgi:hypothetical protein